MVSKKEQAEEWRRHARELRAHAQQMKFDGAKGPLLRLAAEWERYADLLEKEKS